MKKHIFTKLILEYKPKVTDGELTWEDEPFYEEDKDTNILPNKFTDFKNVKNIKAGNKAHTVNANRKRDYSNTVRSFYEN